MSKGGYTIRLVTKRMAGEMLGKYHYLTSLSRGFLSRYNYGLFCADKYVGVCIFTPPQGGQTGNGMFGILPSEPQDGLFELSRLCLEPETQTTEHNITGWFVARAIKALRKATAVRALVSYADSDYHEGTIYRALNFGYYGLTDAKSDFYRLQADGSYVKAGRGPTRGLQGEWRARTRKHRFAVVYDKSLTMRWSLAQ